MISAKNRRFWGEKQSGENDLSEKQAVLGIEAKCRERFVRKTSGFGEKSKVPRTVCPKNRRFWGEKQSGENGLSEKQAVLGIEAKR